MIISSTGPLPPGVPGAGEMLWRVQYTSSWYDSDERGPGDVAVGATAASGVLARSRDAAITKATNLPAFKSAKKQKDKGHPESTVATVATLEDLIPAEDARSSRRDRLHEVKLEHPDDKTRYRLAVCLVPVEP